MKTADRSTFPPSGTQRPRAVIVGQIAAMLANLGGTWLAVLREIFDESAYERFLARNGMERSRRNYAAFCREHHHSKAYRPRCC
ncbi:MAG TPA: hypothetical protein VLT90_09215 [Terriglobales bacterium]|nr:hypothetical protein [Terriglobales bacterium]